MNIKLDTPQPSGNQGYRVQPIVATDRQEAVTASGASVKRLAPSKTTADFSPEALRLSEKSINIGKPEGLRDYLSNYDFENISPKQLTEVASTLYAAGVIKHDEAAALLGTELAYEKPLDINEPLNAVKVQEDRLAASISFGTSGLAGRSFHLGGVDIINRLGSFTKSDRMEL